MQLQDLIPKSNNRHSFIFSTALSWTVSGWIQSPYPSTTGCELAETHPIPDACLLHCIINIYSHSHTPRGNLE